MTEQQSSCSVSTCNVRIGEPLTLCPEYVACVMMALVAAETVAVVALYVTRVVIAGHWAWAPDTSSEAIQKAVATSILWKVVGEK
jgi:hypothetical protein